MPSMGGGMRTTFSCVHSSNAHCHLANERFTLWDFPVRVHFLAPIWQKGGIKKSGWH